MGLPKLQDEILIVDLETTCWEKNIIPAGEVSDIIEIGVAHLDIKTLEITKNWGIYVEPVRSTISEFCTDLTGISSKTIQELGIPIFKAFTALEFEKSRQRTWASWGNFDRKKMETDCYGPHCLDLADILFGKYGAQSRLNPLSVILKYPMAPRHINVKTLFTVCLGLEKEPGMKEALEIIGIKLEGRHHSGKDDANNIAKILAYLLRKTRLGIIEPVKK